MDEETAKKLIESFDRIRKTFEEAQTSYQVHLYLWCMRPDFPYIFEKYRFELPKFFN